MSQSKYIDNNNKDFISQGNLFNKC